MKRAGSLLMLFILAGCGMLPRRTDPPVTTPQREAPVASPLLPVARVLRIHEGHRFVILDSRIPLLSGSEGHIYRNEEPAVTVRVQEIQGRIAAAEILRGTPRPNERVRFPTPATRTLPAPHRPHRHRNARTDF